MSEQEAITRIVDAANGMRHWLQTPRLRWAQTPNTTFEPARLQQLWLCQISGESRWEDVPMEIVP